MTDESPRYDTINKIRDTLRTLLEEKHLYQSTTLDLRGVVPIMEANLNPLRASMDQLRKATTRPWFFKDPLVSKSVSDERLTVTPPDLKLFCGRCNRIEAFNLVSVEDFLERPAEARFVVNSETAQALVLSYRCQSCKGVPEVFLVARQGFRLTNTGRAPIEHVDVPAAIPKDMRRFYGGAIVAHQSGQTLAGIFLLRTLIEQWARQSTEANGFADEALDAYMAALPEDFKSRFPSLRTLYSDISVDLHNATGSIELFDTARADRETF
jgi:hypothetical protein